MAATARVLMSGKRLGFTPVSSSTSSLGGGCHSLLSTSASSSLAFGRNLASFSSRGVDGSLVEGLKMGLPFVVMKRDFGTWDRFGTASAQGSLITMNWMGKGNEGAMVSLQQRRSTSSYASQKEVRRSRRDRKEEEEDAEEEQEVPRKKRGPFFWVKMAIAVSAGLFASHVTNRLKDGSEITESELNFLKRLPLRAASRLWGSIHQVELPLWLRTRLFLWWTNHFGCNLDEMREPLESYRTLNEFFTRKLKDGIRPLGDGLVSPVDGTVLIFGKMGEGQVLEQIKGVNYSLNSFLGEDAAKALTVSPGKDLFYCVFYLSPGDYHGIHSPTDWSPSAYRHFPGYLFPVAPWLVKMLAGLFALNERVVLSGQWRHGYFSLTPVGATNVGSIKLTFPEAPAITTNRAKDDPSGKTYFSGSLKHNGSDIHVRKGEEMAFFHFGSTVVLLFEAPSVSSDKKPEDYFNLTAGQKIKLGETIFRNV